MADGDQPMGDVGERERIAAAVNEALRAQAAEFEARRNEVRNGPQPNLNPVPGFRYKKKKKNMAVHPRVQRYMYRIRPRRTVSKQQRERMRQMGREWGPVLARAREIAKANNRGRISSKDYAQARREMGK